MNPRLLSLTAACCAAVQFAPVQAAADPVTPFNGKNLLGWRTKAPAGRSQWVVAIPALSSKNPKALAAEAGEGALVNLVSGHGQSVDIYSEEQFGSCRIEVEVMVAQGANSGIYVHGEYEVQVLDSFGKTELGAGDMGAVYGAAPPTVNACKKAGEWQKFVIDFQAPRFDADGKKTSNARLKRVELNGTLLHEDVELKGPTPSGVTGQEAPTGPIMFQGDHGPVAYRNLKITPAED